MDNLINIKLENEMKEAYINYAMSVIVARALPDARDGLKPVHRRILHSMNELDLDPGKPYKKGARIVGDTMGKYHPHGESSIYDALVRMAQDFSMRYMLVDGHGNFGSIDGDGAAAQRYTEARLSRISMEMLRDIDKGTVDFLPNYDGEFTEPTVMPSRVPNLLINGTSGIAVGMATNIPPHNLREIVNALIRIIDDRMEGKDTDAIELLQYVKGPDFPTGAQILGHAGIRSAYMTGRGKICVRAATDIQTVGGRQCIIVSELPYMVNKARLVEKIGNLVKEKKVEGLHDLRDESDRLGIRIVIEVKKEANANVVLNNLYKHCQLQDTFSVNMLALVNNEPKILSLKDALVVYLEHQKDVVLRRTKFDLNKALARAHIVEGFLKALDHIDEIISIIRANRDISRSKEIIMERFDLTREQADAIVEMRLRALSGLERERLENEYNELMAKIKELKSVINDEAVMYAVIKDELNAVVGKYGDERRTRILPNDGEIDMLDLIDDEACAVTLTHLDYIKRTPVATYKLQHRGGRGVIGMGTRDEDLVKTMFSASAHDDVLFITNFGKAYKIKAYEIPEAGRNAKGTPAVNLLNLSGEERIAAMIPVREYGEGFLTMISKNGIVKKTALEKFANVKKSGLIAIIIKEGDRLAAALKTDSGQEILIATEQGMGIRFKAGDIRQMGRASSGVRGIKLKENDSVSGAVVVDENEGGKLLLISENGYGRLTGFDEFRLQGRNGKGLKIYKLTEKTGRVAGIRTVTDTDEIMIITSEGIIIRIKAASISTYGRYAKGVKLISLDEGVTVAGMAVVDEEDALDEPEEENEEENEEEEKEEEKEGKEEEGKEEEKEEEGKEEKEEEKE